MLTCLKLHYFIMLLSKTSRKIKLPKKKKKDTNEMLFLFIFIKQ